MTSNFPLWVRPLATNWWVFVFMKEHSLLGLFHFTPLSPFLFPFECRQTLFFLMAFDRDRALARMHVSSLTDNRNLFTPSLFTTGPTAWVVKQWVSRNSGPSIREKEALCYKRQPSITGRAAPRRTSNFQSSSWDTLSGWGEYNMDIAIVVLPLWPVPPRLVLDWAPHWSSIH